MEEQKAWRHSLLKLQSQTLVLAKFVGKPKPSPFEDSKMMRSSEENVEELEKIHVLEYTYKFQTL